MTQHRHCGGEGSKRAAAGCNDRQIPPRPRRRRCAEPPRRSSFAFQRLLHAADKAASSSPRPLTPSHHVPGTVRGTPAAGFQRFEVEEHPRLATSSANGSNAIEGRPSVMMPSDPYPRRSMPDELQRMRRPCPGWPALLFEIRVDDLAASSRPTGSRAHPLRALELRRGEPWAVHVEVAGVPAPLPHDRAAFVAGGRNR